MENFIDCYKFTENGTYYLSSDCEITGGCNFCKKVIKKALGANHGTSSVTFHKSFPDEIAAKIGTVYCENEEGYAVVTSDSVDVYSKSDIGLLFGAYALLRQSNGGNVQKGIVYSYPHTKVRGVKVFLPSRSNMDFFKSFVEYCSYYGCNSIMIETGGALEYKKHPEINEGWEEYCKIFDEYQGKTIDVQNSYGWKKNSIHYENGGGSWLTHEEVRELVDFCRSVHMEVIPEIPSLSHSDYILTRHPELAERAEDPLPNTYCPSNPATYELLFDIFEETIEVFNPNIVNIGHDEYYSIGLCDRCKNKAAEDLYADDINKIYDYFKQRGIKTMLWGDKIINAISYEGYHYGGSFIEYKTEDGREYTVPATYKAIDKIPNDIVIMNWYWRLCREYDQMYFDKGFNNVIYGNYRPMQIFDIHERMDNKIDGYFISNWSSLDPVHIQRNGIFAGVAYAAYTYWNDKFDENDFENNFMSVADNILNYRLKNEGKTYVKVVHTTNEIRPHKEFVDGFLMDYEGDCLGEYTIFYTDGTEQKQKVWFGLNIGNAEVQIGRTPAFDSDMYNLNPYFYEPTYSCSYVKYGDKLYYLYPLAVDDKKEILDIKLTKGADKIHVKEISYAGRIFS